MIPRFKATRTGTAPGWLISTPPRDAGVDMDGVTSREAATPPETGGLGKPTGVGIRICPPPTAVGRVEASGKIDGLPGFMEGITRRRGRKATPPPREPRLMETRLLRCAPIAASNCDEDPVLTAEGQPLLDFREHIGLCDNARHSL